MGNNRKATFIFNIFKGPYKCHFSHHRSVVVGCWVAFSEECWKWGCSLLWSSLVGKKVLLMVTPKDSYSLGPMLFLTKPRWYNRERSRDKNNSLRPKWFFRNYTWQVFILHFNVLASGKAYSESGDAGLFTQGKSHQGKQKKVCYQASSKITH